LAGPDRELVAQQDDVASLRCPTNMEGRHRWITTL
jgi:hypothetical protein